ncbi:unnamed protein product [Meloidogyne enterolobii]|uniref:Uncharacterized protein n=1 Tax=Meloidogyne enterolobii TaxID=390850 RepID=A0ACB1AJV6_MELEN
MFCEEFRENGISDDAKDFISRLLIVEKEKRILPDECLRHCWLLKNRERAALAGAASRAISPALLPYEQQKPLAVEKLRSYVKNKKFRRLVFGVLFVNSVMRMLRTLQQNKSSHGIDYVKNMLAVAECCPERQDESSMLLKAFTKKRVEPTPEKTPERLAAAATEINGQQQKEEINIVKEKEEKQQQQPQTPSTTRRKVRKEKERNGEDLAKKRSKSEARRAVDQQRTRSSTEHTSTKKQRQDNEEEGEGGNIKKISKSSIFKFGLNEEKNQKLKTEEKQKQPKNKSPQPATKNFGINVIKLAQNLEEVTPKQQINALTKIKQQQEEENHQQQQASPKNSFVSKMLQRLEQQKQEEEGKNKEQQQPLTFAVAAIPLKKEDNLIVKSPKVDRKIPINWREEVAMRAEEVGKYVADDLNPYERERSHTTTEKRKKLVKRKVSKVKTTENEEEKIKFEEKMEIDHQNKKENKQNGHCKNKKEEEKMELDNNNENLIKPQTPRTKKKMILVRKRRESTVAPTDGIGVEKGLNGLNHLRQQRISKKFVKSSNSMDESPVVGHDVFDFRLLRMKLQNRIMGMKDEEELATEAENKRKFELQKQQRELQTNLNIKMAMRKWLAMDKESKQQKFSCRRPPTPINGPIPEWAK